MLIPTILRWRGRPLAAQLEKAALQPAQAQQKLLQEFLTRHKDTAFGKDHGFSQIRTPEDYRQALSIHDYEVLRPYVQRMMEGEANVLVSDPVEMFTLTSGTTGQPKYIPVTAFSEARNAALMRQWLYRLLQEHPRCFDQGILGIVSPAVEGYTPSGIPCGSLTGRIYQELPRLMRRAYAVPYAVFEIKDYDARYWAIARFALAKELSFICTPNPSTLLRLASIVEANAEAMIRAIHDGDLGIHLAASQLAPNWLKQLSSQLKPQPKRAQALEKVLAAHGQLKPKDCWPTLKLIGCWTGGSVGIQAQRLTESYGPVPQRDVGYWASEARVTLPIQDHTPSGILDLTLNYCEFIPEAALDDPSPPIYLSHELEVGQRYSILLTTPGGLYRYNIHDIVEVTGFYQQAPLLAFVRKGKDMSSLTGEKLHVDQLLQAVEQVQRRWDMVLGSWQWVADVETMGYRFYTEGLETKEDTWIEQVLLPSLDQALAKLNGEYAQKLASRRLQPLCCHRMAAGWAEALKEDAIAQGGRDVQYKWKVLQPNPHPNPITQRYQQAVLHQSSCTVA